MDIKSTEEKHETGNSNCLKDVRIILLGRKWTGVNQAGNTILGWDGFDSEEETAGNKVRHGEVAGRWRVTVVKTPGWWKTLNPIETRELTKMGIIHSVSLCAPGPHALLLVIDMDDILEEKSGRVIEEHLEILGNGVWNHTIVLLNYGIWQDSFTSVGEYTDKRGKVLGGIIKKCGRRYYLLNSQNRSSKTQVVELLNKIEKMVAANGGNLFELDANIAQDVESKIKDVDEKAKQREISVQMERNSLRETYKGETYHLEEIRLLLMGCILSGKTRIGDTILCVPENTQYCKETRRTYKSVERQTQMGRWTVRLVDTPGWFMFSSLTETPEMVKQEIADGVLLCAPGPHAIILTVCASIAFTEAHLRSIREHMSLLGADVWRHTIVLFTWCDTIGETTVEQFIESEGRALQWLLRKCGNRYHSFNVQKANETTQVEELLEKIEWMAAKNSLFCSNVIETEEWEEEGTVTQNTPARESLTVMLDEVLKRRDEEFLENIRRILMEPRTPMSMEDPLTMSLDEEHTCNKKKLSIWLRQQQGGNEDTSEYESGDFAE
ncbi:GTPase IMAP family member 8-like [Myripristis murdjan]|uniref:GTPase IMAP family member 8-like n=1 Tax=Myripristis murdjan TaxID=586833 RepID=A0A668AR29_9TELE|nr:GTPase IMAP family member 8-like [Myripristis murdjan]